MYILSLNAVQGQKIRNGKYLLPNGLLCCIVLSRTGSHYARLRVIMEFRMRLCGVLFGPLTSKEKAVSR
jgi:hypothetical protein